MHSNRFLLRRLILSVAMTAICGLSYASSGCQNTNTCIKALLENARLGPGADQITYMTRLHQLAPDWRKSENKKVRPGLGGEATGIGDPDTALTAVLKNAKDDADFLPEYHRALALHYLRQKNYDEAESEVKAGIAELPSYAPFWTDLAEILAAKGQHQDAVAALVVGYNWALDLIGFRHAYVKAAQAGETSTIYRDAVKLIDLKMAELEQQETVWPRLVIGNKDPETGKATLRPAIVRCEKPTWPISSLRYRETGSVQLAILIDSKGKVAHVRRSKSSGYSELDNAAIVALAACEYAPAKQDGVAVSAWFAVEYLWTLEE